MNTKLLMESSAATLACFGLAATFFPQEILSYSGTNAAVLPSLFIQLIGALYVGFAIMNWMARANIIGGIYSKPLAMGNFAHFFIGALALIKVLPHNHDLKILWIIAVVYSMYALLFTWVAFNKPGK